MNLPRLLTNDGKNIQRIIHPMNVSLDLNIVPLSYASIRLSKDEFLPARGLVEMFSPYGSVGVFRVRSPQDSYGDEITTAELEHSIAEVGDYLVKEKIDAMMSADSAMKRVFKHYKGSLWKLGNVSALGTDKIALSVNYTKILDAMLSILEQKKDCMMDFDFSTSPWTVKVIKKGTTVEAEGRLARNVTSARISYDDTEMCTRAYYEVVDKKGNSTWKKKDADTISKYGVIEREVPNISSDMTTEEINTVVNTYLNEHKKPRIGVNIEGELLSFITGESMDKFALGKMFRLAIAKYNVVMEDIIVSLSWSDLYRKPKSVTINIGDLEDTVITFLHNLDATGTGGGGGGKKQKEEEDKWREYIADFYKTNATVGLYAERVNKHNEILQKAGIDVNPYGVLVYATDNENSIGSKFNLMNNKIDLRVEKKGVISSINMSPESIVIKSKKIDLKGYVKASDITADYLKAKISAIDNLSIRYLTSARGGINVYSVATTTFTQGGVSCYVPNGLTKITLSSSGNTYTLKQTSFSGRETTIGNFSRAITSSSASWGDGKVSMTLQPQNQTFEASIPTITQTCSNPSAFNFLITASVGGKSRQYKLVVSSTGGKSSFAPV